MPTVRDAAFAVFQHFRVDALFGNPGSTELPMLRAMPEGMDYVLGLNEAVVLAMADGYAQASGRAALVNLHSAAGTGNALGNLFTAFRNGAPIVVTAGQQARALLPHDPYLGAEKAAEFPAPYVKWSIEPTRAEDVPAALARAFHVALTPPTGPVFVSIPVDDWDRACDMPGLPTLSLRTAPDPDGVAALVSLLDTAERPAIVVGAGVARCRGWDAAIALAERSGADVWIAPLTGREGFPEDHPRFAGFLRGFRETLVEALAGYDGILVAGAPAFTWHANGEGPNWPPSARLAVLSDDPRDLAKLSGGRGVLGDVGLGLAALAQGVRPRRAPPTERTVTPPPAALTAAHVAARLATLRPSDTILVEEAPTSRAAIQEHLPVTRPTGFFTTSSGGLGYGLPAAIGVARAMPQSKILCLLGDGSTMYTAQGLWTAAREGANVSFVILNNRGYAALGNFAKRFNLNHLPGTELGGIDFAKLAESLGVPARRVDAVTALDDALEWSIALSGPSLVEVSLDA